MEIIKLTPFKLSVNLCFVCQQLSDKGCDVKAKKTRFDIQNHLKLYLHLEIEEGWICRNCKRRLEFIIEKVDQFRKLVLNGQTTKRNLSLSPQEELAKRCKFQDHLCRPLSEQSSSCQNARMEDSEQIVFCQAILPKLDTPHPQSQLQSTTCNDSPTHFGACKPRQTKGTPVIDGHTHCKSMDHAYNAPKKPSRKKAKELEPTKGTRLVKGLLSRNPSVISKAESRTLTHAICTRSTELIVSEFCSIPKLQENIIQVISQHLGSRPDRQRSHQSGQTSVLMCKDFIDLKSHSWEDVISELVEIYPELVQILLKIMLPPEEWHSSTKIQHVLPKLGVIYGILMQHRNHELSRVQRLIGCLLADNVVDQKVYDRLNKIGICSSYGRMQQVMRGIAGQFNLTLIESLKKGKYMRFIGDNLNFQVGVREERNDRHKHMVHMFASEVLIYDPVLQPSVTCPPQIPLDKVTIDDILLSRAEYEMITTDMVQLVANVMVTYLPHLSDFKQIIPKCSVDSDSPFTVCKTKAVPLKVLPFNEQFYQDDVKILENYEKILTEVFEASEVSLTDDVHMHIGGDQLTRERLSVAKLMQLGNKTSTDQFVHLQPITFEFFHLGMNFMEKLPYKLLWEENSDMDVGSMRCESVRIQRSVKPGAIDAYTPNKDFFVSYTNAMITEGLKDFFGIGNLNDVPSKNKPPIFYNDEDKKNWLNSTLKTFIDSYAFKHWSGRAQDGQVHIEKETFQQYVEVILSNGNRHRIPVGCTMASEDEAFQPDKVKHYGHLTLELGLVFMYYLQLCHTPSRKKLLALLKMMLVMMKACNPQAKYPLEILRYLIQQYCLLPEDKATQVFYAGFVNTRGRIDTYIPADQHMEWCVRQNKRLIKHLFANKTEETIALKSAAMPGFAEIGEMYDQETQVLKRSKGHTSISAECDELKIIEDLGDIHPFHQTNGRQFGHIRPQKIVESALQKLDGTKFKRWFMDKKKTFRP